MKYKANKFYIENDKKMITVIIRTIIMKHEENNFI